MFVCYLGTGLLKSHNSYIRHVLNGARNHVVKKKKKFLNTLTNKQEEPSPMKQNQQLSFGNKGQHFVQEFCESYKYM